MYFPTERKFPSCLFIHNTKINHNLITKTNLVKYFFDLLINCFSFCHHVASFFLFVSLSFSLSNLLTIHKQNIHIKGSLFHLNTSCQNKNETNKMYKKFALDKVILVNSCFNIYKNLNPKCTSEKVTAILKLQLYICSTFLLLPSSLMLMLASVQKCQKILK